MRANAAWLLVLLAFVMGLVVLGAREDAADDPAAPTTEPEPELEPDPDPEPETVQRDGIEPDPDLEPNPPPAGGPRLVAVRTALPGQDIGIEGEDFAPNVTGQVVMGAAGTSPMALPAVGTTTTEPDGTLLYEVEMPMTPGIYVVGVRYEFAGSTQVVTTEVRVAGAEAMMGDRVTTGGQPAPPPPPRPLAPIPQPDRIDTGAGATAA
jgi:hypothetical protein